MEAPGSNPAEEPNMEGKLVFVVDDQAELAHVVAAYLEKNGLAVATFSSPLHALAAAASSPPDLLLTDFRMDEMDGLTLATKLKQSYPDCKMLIMSALAYDAISHPALREFEFLQKPLRISFVLDKVKTALAAA